MTVTNEFHEETVRTLGRRLRPAVVAIDGPAASGKSTLGFRLAALLDYLFLDTGVMYRAVTWAVLAQGIDTGDEGALSGCAHAVAIDIRAPGAGQQDGRHTTVLVDGTDVTWLIRTPEVDRNVSVVSAYPEVRRALTAKQRLIAQRYGRGDADRPGIVLVGRDTGTVVVPDAALKLYVDATPEERARRRFRELEKQGKRIDFDQVLDDMIRRDRIDSEREVAPLRPAADAVRIDNTGQNAAATLAEAVAALEATVDGGRPQC